MNSMIVIVLLMVSALAAPLLGSAVMAGLVAGFSVAIFLLLFVAGWVAQDYIDAAGARRPTSYP
jgi:hypothetical protein